MRRGTFNGLLYLGTLVLAVLAFGLGGPALAAAWGGGDWATLGAVATMGAVAMVISAGYGLLLLQLDTWLRANKDKNERIRA